MRSREEGPNPLVGDAVEGLAAFASRRHEIAAGKGREMFGDAT